MEAKITRNLAFLVKPDEKVIQALVNLEGNNDFKQVLTWILESSAKCDDMLRNAEPPSSLYRAQGAQSVLLEFCDRASNPRAVMAVMKRHQAGIVFPGENGVGY